MKKALITISAIVAVLGLATTIAVVALQKELYGLDGLEDDITGSLLGF